MTNPPENLSHPKYRPDIDGLRAVAVLAVVLYHAFPSKLKGGFVGVDIFFVISGYLISTIIFENFAQGKFSFVEFYVRRIKRIFPALFLVLSSTLIFGWYALLGDEFKQLGGHVIAGAGFVSNLVLWSQSGYFDTTAEYKPLLHLWSLGIEEQFYIVWPLFIWLAWKRKSLVLWVLLAMMASSFLLNVYGVTRDAVATFYSPMTRFWELSAGSLLAYLIVNKHVDPAGFKKTKADLMALVGFVLLASGIVLTNKTNAFPGWWALLPVCGAALVLLAGNNSWLNRRVLSSRLAVGVGLISYPLYLWHWPLLSFLTIFGIKSNKTSLVAVAAAIVLAWLTYALVEKPIRFGGRSRAKAAWLLGLVALVGCAGLFVHAKDGFPLRDMAKKGLKLSEARSDWTYPGTKFANGKITNLNVLEGQQPASVLYVGDSLMGQYYSRAKHIYSLPQKPLLTTVYASRNHCVPFPGHTQISAPENISCTQYYRAALELAREPRFSTVVFGGDWPVLANNGKLTPQGSQFAEDLKALKQLGKRVVVIAKPPSGDLFNPRGALLSDVSDLYVARGKVENATSLASMRSLGEVAGAEVINPFDYLCDKDRCPVILKGEPLYKDPAHIRSLYAESKATFIDELASR